MWGNSSNVVNQMRKARYLKRHKLALPRSLERMKSIERGKGEALNQSPLNHVRQRGGRRAEATKRGKKRIDER